MDHRPTRQLQASHVLALSLALCALLAPSAQDLDVVLRAEFPVDLFTVPSEGPFRSVPDAGWLPVLPSDQAAAALLDEARWVFAGMAWGFDYSYTPSDRARALAERFDITERGSIAWGEPALSPVKARIQDMVLYATVQWVPDGSARAELSAWASADYTSAQGRGSAPAVLGMEDAMVEGRLIPGRLLARRKAVVEACREALRAYLRTIERSKPREVRGSFSFASVPRVVLSSGQYMASVRLRVSVSEVISYGGY